MKQRIALVLVMLALLALACDVNPPAWTPSPPQLTAGALNSTYEARASQTAQAASTPTPSATFTSSIVEVTATRTIVEVQRGK